MRIARLAFGLCLMLPALALAHAAAVGATAWAPTGPTGAEVKALLIGAVVSLYLFGILLGRRVKPQTFMRAVSERGSNPQAPRSTNR